MGLGDKLFGSKNVKSLTYALETKLDPLITKTYDLEAAIKAHNAKIIEKKNKILDLKNNPTNGLFTLKDKLVQANEEITKLINDYNEKLKKYIHHRTFDPNVDHINIEEFPFEDPDYNNKFLDKKFISDLCYEFLLDGKEQQCCGVPGRGIGIGETSDHTEFTFNTDKDKNEVPVVKINQIIKYDKNTALVATEVGIIKYRFKEKDYTVYSTIHGLPSKRVQFIKKVRSSGGQEGLLAITDNGIAWSINLFEWVVIDPNFKKVVTAISVQEDTILTNHIFLGTNEGLYYCNIDEFITSPKHECAIVYLKGLSYQMNNLFINGIAYNTQYDRLYLLSEYNCYMIPEKVVAEVIPELLKDPLNAMCNSIRYYDKLDGTNLSVCYDIQIIKDVVFIGTNNGIFAMEGNLMKGNLITKKDPKKLDKYHILNNFIVFHIIKRSNDKITVLHPLGYTENIEVSDYTI